MKFPAGLAGAVWPAGVPQSPAATVKKHLWASDKLSNPSYWKYFGGCASRDIVQLFTVQVHGTPCPSVNPWVQRHAQKCAAQRGHQQLTGDRRAGKSRPSGTRHGQGSPSASALRTDWCPAKYIGSVYSKATAYFPTADSLLHWAFMTSLILNQSISLPPPDRALAEAESLQLSPAKEHPRMTQGSTFSPISLFCPAGKVSKSGCSAQASVTLLNHVSSISFPNRILSSTEAFRTQACWGT